MARPFRLEFKGAVADFLSIDWLLEQFGKNRPAAQKRYREFVRDGLENRPWEELRGQIYLGSEEFIERHSAQDKEIKEIPRAQLKAVKPTLERIFAKGGETGIAQRTESTGIGCMTSPRIWESITRR